MMTQRAKKYMVLFVDDQPAPMVEYFRRLKEEGFEVTQCRGPDMAIGNRLDCVDLIVLDIMMPPEETYADEDTNSGKETGVLLYHDLLKMYPETPVVILTNVWEPDVLERFYGLPRWRIVQKLDYPPTEFVQFLVMVLNLPEWSDAVERQVRAWSDSGGVSGGAVTHSISCRTADAACNLLRIVGQRGTPAPEVSALSDGGVGIVWRGGRLVLEVELVSTVKARVLLQRETTREAFSEMLTDDNIRRIRNLLEEVTAACKRSSLGEGL